MAAPLPASAFDKEGFLRNLSDWTPAVAEQIASREKIVLSDAHWEVLELLRRYYDTYDASPAMRPLVKYCKLELGAGKGTGGADHKDRKQGQKILHAQCRSVDWGEL